MKILNSILSVICLYIFATGFANAALTVVNDEFGIPASRLLQVESAGVMENDRLDGENAIEFGVTVTLIPDSGPTKGTMTCSGTSLQLCADGSFEYVPNEDPESGEVFDGSDTFQYLASSVSGETAIGVVTLTACEGGAGASQYTCWMESAFVTKLAQLGSYNLFREGFEGIAWDSVRSIEDSTPETGIESKGIVWKTNFPLTNGITTGSGSQNGFWGGLDPNHGDPDIPYLALGGIEDAFYGPLCIDGPTPISDACFLHDGLSGSGTALFAVGGYFSDIGGTPGNISVVLDSGSLLNIGKKQVPDYEFFGIIETSGFTSFQFIEVDGKYGRKFLFLWMILLLQQLE